MAVGGVVLRVKRDLEGDDRRGERGQRCDVVRAMGWKDLFNWNLLGITGIFEWSLSEKLKSLHCCDLRSGGNVIQGPARFVALAWQGKR